VCGHRTLRHSRNCVTQKCVVSTCDNSRPAWVSTFSPTLLSTHVSVCLRNNLGGVQRVENWVARRCAAFFSTPRGKHRTETAGQDKYIKKWELYQSTIVTKLDKATHDIESLGWPPLKLVCPSRITHRATSLLLSPARPRVFVKSSLLPAPHSSICRQPQNKTKPGKLFRNKKLDSCPHMRRSSWPVRTRGSYTKLLQPVWRQIRRTKLQQASIKAMDT
jgi:hypothetical protein